MCLVQGAEAPHLWRYPEDKSGPTAQALYVLAHQGKFDHRGRDTTTTRLEAEVKWTWTDMLHDVEYWRKHCLQCLKLAEGDIVPLPLTS